jgi:hypothetical protein
MTRATLLSMEPAMFILKIRTGNASLDAKELRALARAPRSRL